MAGWSKSMEGSESKAKVASLAGGIVSQTYVGIRDMMRENRRFQRDLKRI
jgi:hypothetical protein